MEPLVKVNNLQVIYNLGKSNEYQALKDINLEIFPGEYVTFFGPSGCGKSTLLYTIAGLEFPTSGEVIVNGANTKELKSKKLIDFHRYTIGMVFQAYFLIPHLSVLNNVLLPQIFSGADINKRNQKAQQLLERFEIAELAKRRPAQLSGGQQQRVAITRALVNDPLIILADEPVGNLDSKNSETVLRLFDDIHNTEKKTIIHVSHNPQDLKYSDKVFYMKDGQIEKVVPNKSVKSATDTPVSDTDQLSQTYPYLNNTEILAKLILNQIISEFSIETQQKMERVIVQFIKGKMPKQKLLEMFDKPIEAGGFNLYKQTAKKFSDTVSQLFDEIKIVNKKVSTAPAENKRAINIRCHLCEKHNLKLSYDQVKRLDELLIDRFNFKLSQERFEQKLDKDFNNGGLGLNKRTVRKICQEIQVIMINKKFK